MRGIIPKRIKGFRDSTPSLNKLKFDIINSVTKVYQRYGFEHWDTPILEYADCLGKFLPDVDTVEEGVYSFRNPEKEPVYTSDGKEMRDKWEHVVMENHFIALRYDLTAPLARMYAENLWMKYLNQQVNFKNAPLFRRYQFGPVFRFETKLDPGRFREFWQLDFDTIGTELMSVDAEVCMVLADAVEAIGLKRGTYIVKVNNRKILKGFLQHLNIIDEEIERSIIRVIDKIDKVGSTGIEEELGKGRQDSSGAFISGLDLNKSSISSIIDFMINFQEIGKRKQVIERLKQFNIHNETFSDGISELEKIDSMLAGLRYNEKRVVFSPALVRGLAYYTGPVFEVDSNLSYIDEKGNERKFGSICGGGRYDDLVKRLLGIKVPATGASIGVDRLAELLTKTETLKKEKEGPVLVVVFDENLMGEYQKIAHELREKKIDTEVYSGIQKGLKKQLSYADKKNCPIAILLGEDEHAKGVVTVRDLKMGEKMSDDITDKEEWKMKMQREVKREELVSEIKEKLK